LTVLRRWWGPKVVAWLLLILISWFIPNGFFIFWGNWVAPLGATVFILIGLVLLVDFAHSWTETCLENWENSDSNLWQWILVGSTAGMYALTITLTGLMYGFFAGQSCTLNQFFITFNLILCIIITVLCIHPAVQEANPRSGLAQASMVALYCTYLIMSAVGNHTHATCNPLTKYSGARKGTVVLGGLFTFIAIAYSTTRAATQGRALVGKDKKSGIALAGEDDLGANAMITTQPSKKDTPRYQALVAAVEAGAIPASALNEMDEDEDEDAVVGEERDDERTGTRYNVGLYSLYFLAVFTDDRHSIRGSTSSLPWRRCTSPCSWSIGRFSGRRPTRRRATSQITTFTLADRRWQCGCVLCRVGFASCCTGGACSHLSRCLSGSGIGNESAGNL
jgi:hypothetical protein